MRLRTRRNGVQPNVDMTPMIDIVFQLILFFLVSTTFAVLPGIKLNLPTSHTAEGTSVQGITITAEKTGEIHFNDQLVTLDTLGQALADYDTGNVEKTQFPVSLQADADVTNGTIVHLFDIMAKRKCSPIH